MRDALKRVEEMIAEANGDSDLLDRLLNEEFKKLQAYNRDWSNAFSYLMEFQNTGMKLEREGLLEEAAVQYEKAIEFGNSSDMFRMNHYSYSYERLAIVYRKLKMYGKEVSLINDALSRELSDSSRIKMNKRIERAKELFLKHEQKTCTIH